MSQEQLTELHDKIEEGYGYWSEVFDSIEFDLAFASGDQWDPAVKAKRAANKLPTPVLNRVHSYVNRTVNPLRMNSLGIKVESDNSDAQDAYQGIIRDIEYKSVASEAYEAAFESAVISGYGNFAIRVDYDDEDSPDMDIRIRKIDDTTMVLRDPNSVAIDGSDAEWALEMSFISETEAEETHGEEVVDTSGLVGLWGSVPMQADMVPVCDYYKIKRERVKRNWLEDGSTIDQDELDDMVAEVGQMPAIVTTREVLVRKLECIRFVGTKVVWEETYNVPYIPIVPVYGDRIFLGRTEKRKFAGLSYWSLDAQRQSNYYSAQEEEATSLSTKSPWLIPFQAIGKFKKIWATANTDPHSYLPYDAKEGVPGPIQTQTAVNTGPMIQSRAKVQEEMGEILGIRDPMMGQQEGMGGPQSGVSLLARQSQGEVSTAQYLDNLSKSIAHAGAIVKSFQMELSNERTMPYAIRTEDGTVEKQQIDLGQMLRQMDWEIKTTAGPAYETRKKEALNSTLQLIGLMPDKAGIVADLVVKQMGGPGAEEISARFAKLLPPELRDDATDEDPEAVAALQQAEQTIQQIEQARDQAFQAVEQQTRYIEQLQNEIQDEQEKYKTQVMTKQMEIEGKLAQEQIKQENENARLAAKLESDGQSVVVKATTDVKTTMAKINADAEKQTQELMAKGVSEQRKDEREVVREVTGAMDKISTSMDKAVLKPVVQGPVDASMGVITDISE